MSTPFTISGSLNYPGDPALPADQLPFSASGSFDHEASAVLKLSGSGTHQVDLGTIPAAGAKAVLLKLDAGSNVLPVTVGINGSSTGKIELAAGGCLLVSNPLPTAGITALSLDHTSACVVRVWVLG